MYTTAALCLVTGLWMQPVNPDNQPAPTPEQEQVTIEVTPKAAPQEEGKKDGLTPQQFTARFTARELIPLVESRSDILPLPMQLPQQQESLIDALERISMQSLLVEIRDSLSREFPGQFNPAQDLIIAPVSQEQQITLPTPELETARYSGPETEVIGFLLHDISESQYINVAIQVMQIARQLLDSGNPIYDRTSAQYYPLLAEREVERMLTAQAADRAAAEEKEAVRRRIATALDIYDPQTDSYEGTPNWMKESRRFSYIINQETGDWIDRIQPMVERYNRDLALAGFSPPSTLEKPGIHYDPDLDDVEILLPKPMLEQFLQEADQIEARMAESRIISIEAVRLTDRDIVDGAIASRLNAQVRGVHDVERFNTGGVIRQLGLNSLLAVANQRLQVGTLQAIEAGGLPAGVPLVSVERPELPPLQTTRTNTTVGSAFSVGADDIFFDGRQQSYGFSYIGADGIEHTLSFDVVDSLREFWDRIERNLIVHKIKKVEKLTSFSVPVGPESKTYEGIAALISQEDQQLVVATGTGAISQISATAGTWLIIEDFNITPIPGSSTTLAEDELNTIKAKVLLTMFLRDPNFTPENKRALLSTESRGDLLELEMQFYESMASMAIRPGRYAKTYQTVFEERFQTALEDASVEKKEQNSSITLSFYSSQGNIIQQPGVTQLGDANDLTSFTTELRPNTVTPISSFFTKSGSGAKGTSPLTGISKGERTNEEKTMTHLIIRARFPNIEREKEDRDEGRHLGYFELPITQQPSSTVNLPFLSSSEHPIQRLANLRVGLMFDALQEDRVKRPLKLIDPNSLAGTVPMDVWETASTRMLMNRKIISDSPTASSTVTETFRQRFITEVRSLLEYDEDFNEAPNFALRNMTQWNSPDRIILALNNNKFATAQLIQMIDELGQILVPEEYADQFLARSPLNIWGNHKVEFLAVDELRALRRDAAAHYLRFQEVYGDAFLEAIATILDLGTYQPEDHEELMEGPLRGYHDLVIFDSGSKAMAEPELFEAAHQQFMVLKRGGIEGGWFEPSLKYIKDLPEPYQKFITRGRDILHRTEWWR